MKSISILAVASLIVSLLVSVFVIHHNALYVIGGEYVLQEGETVNGDLYVVFADVTVQEGAYIHGDIFSLCSDVHTQGTIEGRSSSLKFFNYTILIPTLTRLQIF